MITCPKTCTNQDTHFQRLTLNSEQTTQMLLHQSNTHRKVVLVIASVDKPEADVTQSSILQSSGRTEQQQAQSQDKQADTKAVQHKTVVALKGQLLHWRLLVANSGQLCLNFLGSALSHLSQVSYVAFVSGQLSLICLGCHQSTLYCV